MWEKHCQSYVANRYALTLRTLFLFLPKNLQKQEVQRQLLLLSMMIFSRHHVNE